VALYQSGILPATQSWDEKTSEKSRNVKPDKAKRKRVIGNGVARRSICRERRQNVPGRAQRGYEGTLEQRFKTKAHGCRKNHTSTWD